MKVEQIHPVTTTNLVYHNGKKLSTLLGSLGLNSAILVSYDNSTSKLLSSNVQEAIDEIIQNVIVKHVLITSRDFEKLSQKDPNVIYMVYEDESEPDIPTSEISGTTLIVLNTDLINNTLILSGGEVLGNSLVLSGASTDVSNDASFNAFSLLLNGTVDNYRLNVSGTLVNNTLIV